MATDMSHDQGRALPSVFGIAAGTGVAGARALLGESGAGGRVAPDFAPASEAARRLPGIQGAGAMRALAGS